MTYEQALKAGKRKSARASSDAELMALILDGTAQILAGAVSPKLIWEGAQLRGLTTAQVLDLLNKRDLGTIDDLQFGDAP